MKEYNVILLAAGMMLVTYIPRLIPLKFIRTDHLNSGIRTFLESIPYTILGALIFPSIINAVPDRPLTSIISGLVCLAASYFKGGLIIPVILSILTAFLLQIINLPLWIICTKLFPIN